MATFVAIAGPMSTGKTTLAESLSTYKEMSKVKISPDFHTIVWTECVENGIFLQYTEITKDGYYLCTYLHKLVDYYNEFIESCESYDGLVLLDGCWIDLAIYAELNMWYDRVIKPAQEDVFEKIMKYADKLSRVYITKAADSKYPVDKDRVRGRVNTFKMNRPLEITLYHIASRLKESVPLTHADVSGDSLDIISDLKKLGYI